MSVDEPLPPLFHVTSAAEWDAAKQNGSFTGSTRGRSLAEVGFIHCSFAAQTADVVAAIYYDFTEPLVLLEIDPAAVPAEIKIESADGTDQHFPHIYGPLPLAAVVQVQPLG